jgi:hypothetical protein
LLVTDGQPQAGRLLYGKNSTLCQANRLKESLERANFAQDLNLPFFV